MSASGVALGMDGKYTVWVSNDHGYAQVVLDKPTALALRDQLTQVVRDEEGKAERAAL